MTEILPVPLVPDGVDLRDFPFTPIFRARLFGSAFHSRCSDGGWRAGVTLWLKSWDQAPAGSLPEDDESLCRLAELGRDLKSWRKVKAEALHGWVKCSDGRLYHEVVAEGVREAWKRKGEQRDRTEAARAAKAAKRVLRSGGTVCVTKGDKVSVTERVTERVTESKRQGQGQGDSPQKGPAGADLVRIGSLFLSELGADPDICMNFSLVGGWLNAGYSEDEIIAAGMALAPQHERNRPNLPLAYFRTAVGEAILRARSDHASAVAPVFSQERAGKIRAEEYAAAKARMTITKGGDHGRASA